MQLGEFKVDVDTIDAIELSIVTIINEILLMISKCLVSNWTSDECVRTSLLGSSDHCSCAAIALKGSPTRVETESSRIKGL